MNFRSKLSCLQSYKIKIGKGNMFCRKYTYWFGFWQFWYRNKALFRWCSSEMQIIHPGYAKVIRTSCFSPYCNWKHDFFKFTFACNWSKDRHWYYFIFMEIFTILVYYQPRRMYIIILTEINHGYNNFCCKINDIFYSEFHLKNKNIRIARGN